MSDGFKTVVENLRHLNTVVEKMEVVLESLIRSMERQDEINKEFLRLLNKVAEDKHGKN